MTQAAPTLDQVVTLIEEMAELVRAGIPLHEGILHWGRGAPGRLRHLADQLGSELARGRPLPDVLDEMEDQFPAACSAIVRAGMAAGNLPAALDTIARSAGGLMQVRAAIAQAIIYPIIVMLTALTVVSCLLFGVVRPTVEFFEYMSEVQVNWLPWVESLSGSSGTWLPCGLLLLVVAGAFWFFRMRALRQLPFQRMRADARNQRIAALVADLLENGTPLAQSVELAGQATGDERTAGEMAKWAERLKRGQVAVDPDVCDDSTSPWIRWLLSREFPPRHLVTQLRAVAKSYEEDVSSQIHWWKHAFPLWLTIALGGTATAVVAMTAYGPWYYILYKITP